MNKYILLIVLLFLVSGRIAAQSVTVDAKIDSLQILIGEQAKVQLQVAMDAKQRAVFPSFTDTLVRGVEIVDIAKPDTQYLNDRQRMLITQEYTVTSFDSALYYIPPMGVKIDNKEYKSKALALKVYSIFWSEDCHESSLCLGGLVWFDCLLFSGITIARIAYLSDHPYP